MAEIQHNVEILQRCISVAYWYTLLNRGTILVLIIFINRQRLATPGTYVAARWQVLTGPVSSRQERPAGIIQEVPGTPAHKSAYYYVAGIKPHCRPIN